VTDSGPASLRPPNELPRPSPLRSAPSPADKVVIAYLAVIAALILLFAFRVLEWWMLVPAHCIAIAATWMIGRWLGESAGGSSGASAAGVLKKRRLRKFFRSWYPLFLIPLTYKELSYLIPRVNPHDLDWQLEAIDIRLFGVNPTLWLERLTYPALSEIFQIAYTSYYILPVVLGIVIWLRNPKAFGFYVYLIVLAFYLSYLGYISVPAIGPRFILSGQFSKPLGGLLLAEPIRRMLDHAEGITRDCFPSGHTELTMVVLYSAWLFHRPSFRWMLPVGTALIIATVYLRYHYVVDVVAGALLALLIMAIARPLYARLGGTEF
jgi:membrane-associated phospholipid phosphatase